MDPMIRAFIIGITIGVIIALLSSYLGKGESFYIRMAGIIAGFAITTLLLTGRIHWNKE